MTDDEGNDLLGLKNSIQKHLSILHEELIRVSAQTKDDPYFDTLLKKRSTTEVF